MTLPSLSTKTIFKVSSYPMIFHSTSILHTLQHQQTQDAVLKTVYHWIRHNANADSPTLLIHGSPFLHAYYKIFSHFFIDHGTNLISSFTKKNKIMSDTQPNTTPSLFYSIIRICLPFRLFKTAFNKLHAHCHTGTKITYNTFS